MDTEIPHINIAGLFETDGPVRRVVDAAIREASETTGLMVITGLPEWANFTAKKRDDLLRIFKLPESEIKRLWLWNFDHSQKNVYRGWFPLQNGFPTYKEGIDIGPDIVHGKATV